MNCHTHQDEYSVLAIAYHNVAVERDYLHQWDQACVQCCTYWVTYRPPMGTVAVDRELSYYRARGPWDQGPGTRGPYVIGGYSGRLLLWLGLAGWLWLGPWALMVSK